MSATRGWHARGGERVLWGTRRPLEAVKWRLRLCPPAEDAPAPPAVRDGPGPLLPAGRGRCALETRGISARGAWKNSDGRAGDVAWRRSRRDRAWMDAVRRQGGLRDGLTVKSRMRQSCRGHQGSSHCPGQGPLGCFCGLDSAHISAVFARDRTVASCLS